MPISGRRIRRSTFFLVTSILALACILVWQQRKEKRLRTALAIYKSRSHKRVVERLSTGAPNLDWPNDTPLGEVIEEIKLSTERGFPAFPLGVPVAIDSAGLEEVGRSLGSPVKRPPADQDLCLGKKLRTVLKPLGLACHVKDATIVITSERMVVEPFEDQNDDEP